MGKQDRPDLESLGNSLELTLVEAAVAEFDFDGRNRHSFNRLFFVVEEGRGGEFIHNHTNGQHLPLRRGNVYFMPGHVDLGFRFTNELRLISFHFYLELFGFLDVFHQRTECACLPDEAGLGERMAAIIQSDGWSSGRLCHLRGGVLQSAGDFLSVADGEGRLERLGMLHGRYGRLFEHVRYQGDAQTSVDDLAKVVGMTRDALSRAFSRDCGLTVKQYLCQSLTRKAEHLLLAPAATARSVAEALGFTSEFYFSRFFRQHTGITTREYRARIGRER